MCDAESTRDADSTGEAGPPGAVVIPFPRPRRTPAQAHASGSPDPAQQRLARALAALDAGLVAQREAVAKWRQTLAELRGSLHGLGTSLAGYNDRLNALGTQVGVLNAKARRLESWADEALRRD